MKKLPKCVCPKHATNLDVAIVAKDGQRWLKKFFALKISSFEGQKRGSR